MASEQTGVADPTLYAEYDMSLYNPIPAYADPALYMAEQTYFPFTFNQQMFQHQQMLFHKHRIDQARFNANSESVQMGVAVMQDGDHTGIDYEIEWFLYDDGYDPLQPRIEEAKKKAQEFMQHVKTKFPNRYFILKRVTDQPEIWQYCAIEKNYIVIQDDSYAKKLQNCYEVIIDLLFLSLLTVNLLNRFQSTSS